MASISVVLRRAFAVNALVYIGCPTFSFVCTRVDDQIGIYGDFHDDDGCVLRGVCARVWCLIESCE